MNKFKIGDKVIYNWDTKLLGVTRGRIYDVIYSYSWCNVITLKDDNGDIVGDYSSEIFELVEDKVEEFIFKVGDKFKVPWSDEVFTIIKDSDHSMLTDKKYPLEINSQEGNFYTSFTRTGKLSKDHDKPVLTLVERPKKLKEVTREVYANVYGHTVGAFYSSNEEAIHRDDGGLNKTNKLVKITYYVEVDDE